MKNKRIIMTTIITILICSLLIIDWIYNKEYDKANVGYMVYLKNQLVGMIKDENKLYDIIDKEQEELKNKYGVDSVYPPSDFKLVKVNTFNNDYKLETDVYKEIEKLDDFMLKGYIITIKFVSEENEEDGQVSTEDDLIINVLDKQVFEDAIKDFVYSFIPKDELANYLENKQQELTDIGQIINLMYFNETITIKEGYISSNSKIFTDSKELSQYLLFGPNAQMTSYTVQLGDDIESISDANKLNPQEFLVANPTYRNENAILKVGDQVNVTVLNPILTFIYEVEAIEEVTIPFNETTKIDNTKPVGYSEITQAGVTGLTKNHENYRVINGEQSQEMYIEPTIIRDKVDQIRTIGPKKAQTGGQGSGSQTILEGDWTWPTNEPSVITSKYKWRSLRGISKMHEGIDISGTGYNSPIYAIGDGEVVITAKAAPRGSAHWSNGTYVVIKHSDNLYSAYLHLASFNVKVGQKVLKGERIASMGNSGYVTGTHLHLGLWDGLPYSGTGAKSMNPLTSIPAFANHR